MDLLDPTPVRPNEYYQSFMFLAILHTCLFLAADHKQAEQLTLHPKRLSSKAPSCSRCIAHWQPVKFCRNSAKTDERVACNTPSRPSVLILSRCAPSIQFLNPLPAVLGLLKLSSLNHERRGPFRLSLGFLSFCAACLGFVMAPSPALLCPLLSALEQHSGCKVSWKSGILILTAAWQNVGWRLGKGAEEHPGTTFLTSYYHCNPVLQFLKDGGIIFSFSSQLITLL